MKLSYKTKRNSISLALTIIITAILSFMAYSFIGRFSILLVAVFFGVAIIANGVVKKYFPIIETEKIENSTKIKVVCFYFAGIIICGFLTLYLATIIKELLF